MAPFPLPKPHPRLFCNEDGFKVLKEQVRADPLSARIFACLQRKADVFCNEEVSTRVVTGRRLLDVSRTVLTRVSILSLVARLGGEERYVRRAVREMLAVAGFSDWHPVHFLDVAEMTLALAIGYDWLYDFLSEEERETVAAAITHKGIDPSRDEKSPNCGWIKAQNNWNQVCHAGMTAGALAVAERDPETARVIVERAVANVPLAARTYAPNGAYAEGPSYWGYGTTFEVILLSMLESALGHDYSLAESPGFLESAYYIYQVTGPGGKYFNYSDSRDSRSVEVAMFWLARRLHDGGLLRAEIGFLEKFLAEDASQAGSEAGRLLAFALVWHQPALLETAKQTLDLPCHWLGRGHTPVGVHRTAWNDPLAAFVAMKGGTPSASHAHMDAGVFVLEADGVRWAVDLGMQEYNSLEQAGLNIWASEQDSDRWKVFRLSGRGHSVPNFNGAPPLVQGNAPIVRFQAGGAMPHTVADLSSLYSDHVPRAWRGVGLLPDGRIILQDEWTAESTMAVDMNWQMLTFAKVAVEGASLILKQDGKELRMQILEPTESDSFRVEVLERSKPEHAFDVANPGLSVIVITCHTPAGQARTLRIVATLPPVSGRELPTLAALETWSSPLLER